MDVNGVVLDEPYLSLRNPRHSAEFSLGPDEYFVVGDNRGMPMELDTMGRVVRDRLIGPVLW